MKIIELSITLGEKRRTTMTLHITNVNNDEMKKYVRDHVFYYNMQHFPDEIKGRYQEIHLFLQDEEGQVYGGLLGETCWNWLEIHYLFVEPSLRGQRYGRKLIQEVEKIALKKKCDFIKVDTLSFQALDFYEKEGYEVYGKIENAGGYTHYYMKKELNS